VELPESVSRGCCDWGYLKLGALDRDKCVGNNKEEKQADYSVILIVHLVESL
jgi:hypothetical protein